jgi:branched-chain amino acid transport system substrate-binding protein
MRSYFRPGAAAVIALAWMPALACTSKEPITFGVVLDADGLRGATAAAEEVNARGGIGGRRVALLSVGGAGSTKASIALQAAESLAAIPAVLGVIGHVNSAASLAASQVYNSRHVVQIAPTSSTPVYSLAGPYSFRLVGSDVHQGAFLANVVLSRNPRPRTAILFVNDDYGRPLRAVVVEHLTKGGLTPVHDAPFIEGADMTSRAEMIAALARARPDLLLWIGRSYEYVPILDTLEKALPKIVVIASDGFAGGSVTHDSLHRLDGVSYVRLVDWSRPSPALQQLRALYLREGWGEPADQAVLAYDAVLVLSEAVRNAGTSREAIRNWLERVGTDVPPVQGLSGPIAFLPNGDRKAAYFLEEIGKARRDSTRGARD